MLPHTAHVLDSVDDYLHDLLDDVDADRVARHCAACATCGAALEEARKRLTALQTVPPTEASEELVRDTVTGVEKHERRRRRQRIYVLGGLLGAFAAAALVLVGFHLHYANLSPTPFDLKVIGQSQLTAGSPASLRVQVVKRFPDAAGSFLRYQGIHVEIALVPKDGSPPRLLTSFQTGADGSGEPRFQVPDWADQECELVVTADAPDGPETVRQAVRVKRSWRVMLSSDKPVYQPGQTIQLRSLALRQPDLHPLAGDDATFTVTDPKGNVVFKQVMKNSAYGIAWADCPLADEIIEGQYVIACTVGDTPSRLSVQVQKYVLPKFKVGVALDKPYYKPGQEVTATVDGHYFFGKPVTGLVQLEARAEGQPQPLFQAGAKTDDNGRAVFSFTLPKKEPVGGPPDPNDLPLKVQATLTDSAGQKQATTASCVVTDVPLKLEAIPEGGQLVQNVPNTIYFFASSADGRPIQADLFIPGELAPLHTDETGVASLSFTPGAGGPDWIVTMESGGMVTHHRVHLIPTTGEDDFLLRTDRATYDGGDTVSVSVVGSGVGPIFVDLLQDGQTLLTATISSMGGQCALDLPPELSGMLRLEAYRLDQRGISTRKTRTLYVRPAGSLQVKTTTEQDEYRPGHKARLNVALLDKAGQPVRGALSLAAVDEAVFSVLQQAPGSERRFFGQEPDYPRPDLAAKLPPAERNRLEQAWLVRQDQEAAHANSNRWGRKRAIDDDSDEATAIRSVHSLNASTFTMKSQQVMQERHSAMRRVISGWVVWGVALALTAYFLMWLYVRPWYLIAVFHAAGIIFLGGGLMFSVVLTAKKSAMAPTGAAEKQKIVGEMGAFPADGADRVRQNFPETLLWRPQVITDDDGRATLDLDLADSITSWRLTASAVTADGRLGAVETGIKVFQPFFVDLNLPVSLTRGDEVSVPVVVYSYLDKPQTVELTLAASDWFDSPDGATKKIEVGPREVRSVSYRLRVKLVGKHALQVTAKGGELSDAIRRDVEVVPDGRRVEEVVNGTLGQPAEVTLTVPENSIDGSARVTVKIYPSSFSQLVEGLDGIFRKPYGCFEQTSSTTYPNVLALAYLKQTGQAAPEVRKKAEEHIHLGYQRLLGFEVSGGGFDWFGRAPANRTLTAYGLMEFQDMAKVYPVDPQLIQRTRTWLLNQRKADGSWAPESHGFAGDPGREGREAQLSTTAFIAWALSGWPGSGSRSDPTRSYLLSHKAESLDDPYVLALVANALNALDPDGPDALSYLNRLDALKKSADDGRLAYWEQPAGRRTAFYGAGRGGQVETTALAALALLHRNQSPETTRRALAWLVKQKGEAGTWSSTQATVLALKALVAGTGKPAGDGERRITLTWDGEKREIVIPADQAEVMKQIDLSAGLKPGKHRLTLTGTNKTAAGYQVAFHHHIPDTAGPQKSEALEVRLAFDSTEVRVGATVQATATVTNLMKQAAPMVVLEVPIPAGFAFEADRFLQPPPGMVPIPNAVLRDPKIEKYQVTPQTIVVYARGLEAGQSLKFKYGLRATMPAKVSVPAARAYEYYDPDKLGTSAPAKLTAVGN
jgi:A-macroglobulin TED domain/Alpha-2-macroglobulin family/MG2 domain/Macroglobulin domain MG3/Bacterial Alpha-2-macroglobulin MG10 domain